MGKNIFKSYFSHDVYARQDQKIKNMLAAFRKESNQKAQSAYCIFWWIVEDMHADVYPTAKLEVFADDYRCEVDFLKSILDDFGLFRIENDCYISDRVLRNIAEQEEKSEKAKKSANNRWKKIEIDNEFVDRVIDIYNTIFEKAQVVSKENRYRINKITKENELTLEIWQKVFENASRGWDLKDGTHKLPSFKNILDEWDAFASGDYYLAPDRKKAKEEKEKEEKEKAETKEKENAEIQEQIEQLKKDEAEVFDKTSAIKYLNKAYYKNLPEDFLAKNKTVQMLMKKYNFEIKDIIKERRKENV